MSAESPSKPRILIDEVTVSLSSPHGFEFGVDTPMVGYEIDGYFIRVEGWARGDGVHATSAYDVGALLVTNSNWHPRSDVDATTDTGFVIHVPLVGLPENFSIQICAETASGTVLMNTINGRRTLLPAVSWDDDGPSPLAITGMGRSGTSWLMNLLGRHSDIAVDPRWPHELSSANFQVSAFRRLLDRPNGLDHPPTRELTVSGTTWTSYSPFDLPGVTEWYNGEHVERLARVIRDDMSAFAHAMAGHPVRYLAEKTRPDTDTRLVLELFPRAREIILVRDFRDVLTSIFAFSAKYGAVFGRDPADTDEQYARRLAGSSRALETWVERSPDALVVKYEDLVSDPVPTIQAILSHLDLPSSPGDAAQLINAPDIDEMQGHRTTESAAASIGRWRTDLSPDMQQVAEAEFRQSLDFFGYA